MLTTGYSGINNKSVPRLQNFPLYDHCVSLREMPTNEMLTENLLAAEPSA